MWCNIRRILILETDDDESYFEKLVTQLKSNKEINLLYDSDELEFNNLKIDIIQNKVVKNGIVIYLTKSEFQVIKLLCLHPGQVFSKESVFELVWGEKSESCLHAVENMISRLRKKIEDDPSNPKYIVTVRGFGYKFKEKENER